MEKIQAKPFKCVCGNVILLFGNMVVCGRCGEMFVLVAGKRENIEKIMKDRPQKNPFE